MLDIKFIRENARQVKDAAKHKNIKVDIDELLKLDEERRGLRGRIDELRVERNELADAGKKGKPTAEQIARGKNLKEKIAQLEKEFIKIEEKYEELMVKAPTVPAPDTPIGQNDGANVEVYKWGEPTKFDFEPKSHMELAESLDLIDFERGAKVAGYRGYYVRNELVMLQMSLMMYALEKLMAKGFTPMIPPTLVREFALFGSGYFAGKNYNPETDEIYKIANDEKLADGSVKQEDRFLVGTAEPSLLAYYANEVLDEKDLPLKICGFSTCYRSEIGSYGKDTKGIYRVHEFMKVEQICVSKASVDEADKLQEEMINISKKLHEDLGLPYRQLRICSGDLSAGKYKQYDLEAWIPSREGYGETGSASNFLDWQSRRLNIKYKDSENKKRYAYLLNNTAIPTPRVLIAILENFQQADGSVVIPKILHKYLPDGMKIIAKKN
ncbi:serine--tRNA ligase [Candidatus Falkowbacteria bacterium CG10_big_fil_rev_8_21_14_0_10_43_11]|uniref:Serine--tRNA ligase n=1 Tax=Candidatus Falkowbacteria bacterium CG10_big_fil_rev_8_21_14_0_10_43_11 TaxID=1974568 RepID=A0A2M6WMP2_9BACT|nr:MAG: serine--tRNA ligase [Candidatus Falkowbacteria bacterium CG10_big_fil_rev_8_21_14_0_10_43_11]